MIHLLWLFSAQQISEDRYLWLYQEHLLRLWLSLLKLAETIIYLPRRLALDTISQRLAKVYQDLYISIEDILLDRVYPVSNSLGQPFIRQSEQRSLDTCS